jgi:peptide/nickel transport system permease protein
VKSKLKYSSLNYTNAKASTLGLKNYIGKRIIYMLILVWAVITVNFLIFTLLPGSPIDAFVEGMKRVDASRYEELKALFGLNKPLHEQYLLTLTRLITFQFGNSIHYKSSVADVILRERMPNTLLLMGISTVIHVALGMLIGVLVAYKRGGAFDTLTVTASLVTFSVPIFFIGWLLIAFFAIYLGWFPIGLEQPVSWTRTPPANLFELISGRLYYIALPTLTLVLFTVGGWILLTRACVLETINEDYVVTARAKGLKERTVLYKHVLKNASLPLITNAALSFAGMISGAIITETLFSYRGMGLLTWEAITGGGGGGADLPLLQAIFYILALCVIIANFVADLLYGVIDPRIKYG